MIIDTHCHLDFKEFDRDRDAVLERAKAAGVGRVVNVGSSPEGSRRAVALASKYDTVYASVGVHPHDAASVTDAVMAEMKALAKSGRVVAIGEVGLDYYRNLSPREVQIAVFGKFIALAQELKLPLIIHAREANVDVLDMLRGTGNGLRVSGVMHCFSGDESFLKSCLDLGLYVSFTCNLTFKNAKKLRETAKLVPVERLMLETDAPYLAPEGMRGKRNEPSYMTVLLDEWAKLLGLSKEDIARITTHNANEFFNLGIEEASAIAYPIRDSLYLNITNSCSNECDFCVRAQTEFVKGHMLRLGAEPSVAQLVEACGDPSRYKEIVFCGYGEPTERLDTVKLVATALKAKGARIRLVTNGQGDLINGRGIASELIGLIDKFSISLNFDRPQEYLKVCRSRFGANAYPAVIEFIKECVDREFDVEVTALDLPGVDVKKCEKIARELGAGFRLRKFGAAG
jgi:TatD DNase family protein